MKTQTENVLARFDSIDHAAQTTGESKTNWYNWKRSGDVPQTKHLSIIKNARSAGVEIHPSDFYTHLLDQLIEENAEAAGEVPAANEGTDNG